jgi:hypothetical protein
MIPWLNQERGGFMRALTWALMVLLSAAGICRAQGDNAKAPVHKKKSAAASPKFQPIEIQTFGWGNHATNGYYYNGLPLTDPRDFQRVIDPLNDPQASQLLRSAADKGGWGTGLLVGGIALEAAGWVDFTIVMTSLASDTGNQGPDLGPSLIMILGGTGIWVGGLLLEVDGGNDRYNAVNRYNYVVQHDNSLSLMFLPETNQPGLTFTQRF